MEFMATAKSALTFDDKELLEDWVHLFLSGEGMNIPFSDGLKLEKRLYCRPELMDLDLFERCAGPEEGMPYVIPADSFYARVERIATRYANGDWDMPPLIINRDAGRYELNDGNHRFEALKQLGIKRYWVIIWATI